MDEGIAIKSKAPDGISRNRAQTQSKSTMDLGDAKRALDKIVKATNSSSRTDCVKQIIFQLERSLEKSKSGRFVFGDITINRQ